jgi:type IV pilus assembly protein PilW
MGTQKIMNTSANNSLQKQAGFTLVELMVGLVIGLIATLVIMQVFSTFEGQKRSTTGTADAQTNGSIGLYSIQREVQKAGFGLPIFDGNPSNATTANNSALNCAPAATVDHDKNAATGEIDIFPIEITDGGVGVSDTVTVRYGDSQNGGLATSVQTVASPTLGVDNTLGCENDDLALFIQSTTCVSGRVVDTNLDFDTTHMTLNRTANAAGTVNMVGGGSGRLSCVGQYNQIAFGVNANNELTRTDNTGIASPVISEIVDIQAQYGITATANSNQITQWVDATGVWATPALPATMAGRNRIRAVRIAIVARNNLLEKTAVTTACSSLTNAAPTGLCAWDATSANPTVASPAPSISLAAIGGANYRYRVYETIIPIRNMTFSGVLL